MPLCRPALKAVYVIPKMQLNIFFQTKRCSIKEPANLGVGGAGKYHAEKLLHCCEKTQSGAFHIDRPSLFWNKEGVS